LPEKASPKKTAAKDHEDHAYARGIAGEVDDRDYEEEDACQRVA
jgi:hypothetical protein